MLKNRYTVKDYAAEFKISESTARSKLNKLVSIGKFVIRKCWKEHPKKYYAAYSGCNLPPISYNLYILKEDAYY